MKIESIQIKNFRSFRDETIYFGSYTCLVGPNGSGKSNVLCALNAFFRETENVSTNLNQLDREDFHAKNTKEPIRITVTFSDLNSEAQQDFSDYYRQGKLIISAVARFDDVTQKAEIKQFGNRMAMPALAPFFEALNGGAKVGDLKSIYSEMQKQFQDLPVPGTKDAMVEALQAYEAAHPELCQPIQSEDQFYGFSKGVNRLAKHMQWVYVPAVKDPTAEQVEAKNTALGKLLARTVRSKANFDEEVKTLRIGMQTQYQQLLDKNQHVLDGISSSLKGKIVQWAHPNASLKLEWKQDLEKSVRVEEPWAHIIAGEGDFEGGLARFGHGLQRSYFLALLHELALSNEDAGPQLILGCEEPELYQHPPQARHLASVLETLSKKSAQIMVSTHSPLFVSGEGFENVRTVRKCEKDDCSLVSQMSYKELADLIAKKTDKRIVKPEGALAKIHQALQPHINEMFFTRKLILVEGIEDVAYISSYMHLLGKDADYRALGFHMVAVNGKSELIQPLIIAKHMNIPTYIIFDSDADKPDKSGSKEKHRKDNEALLKILGLANPVPMPTSTIWGNGFTMWHSDIGTIAESEIGITEWATYQKQADGLYGQVGGLRKNPLHVGATLALAWNDKKKSQSLEQLCNAIIDFGSEMAVKQKKAA